ncbi:MAG: alkylmercury lyase family protein [Planctomycetota bacterium]
MTDPPADLEHQPLDSAVHRGLLLAIIERGRASSASELASALGESEERVRDSLARLDANHGLVLHPGGFEPWLVHPFSTTPTAFYVEGAERGWWAPCVWCALGVAHLVPGPVRIHGRLGGEAEPCCVDFDAGRLTPAGLVAHFPIPVARAWDNVHRFCGSTLIFSATDAVDGWCERHGVARGEVVPLEQVAELARVWYGGHLAPDWRKPTASEARTRLESVGLTADHWRVPGGDERF